jgi:hypothetical protein
VKNKTFIGYLIIFVFLAITIFSGCINEKISATDEINTVENLMNSGADRMEGFDLNEGGYSNAKTKLMASKVDYEEALIILNNAKTDYEDEKEIIEINKIMIGYNLDLISALQNFIISMEHFDKSVAYMDGDDFVTIKSELKLANDAWADSKPFLSKAKEKSLSINQDTIPVEYKSEILEKILFIEQYEKMFSEMGEMLSVMNPYVDAMEHLHNAGDYMEQEEWKNAEIEFGNSYADFSRSKNIVKELKNSELTEVSVLAIEVDTYLTEILNKLPPFEAGCRYMSEGNFYKAEAEFNKISEY